MKYNLDKEQELAVKTNKKKVIIAAGAGSGKTTVITERLKFLLNNNVDPKKIFAITYTNNAANEMRERVNNSDVFIGTIHSLANFILLSNGIDTSSYIEEEEFDHLFKIAKKSTIKLPEVEHLLIDEFQDICDNEYEFTLETLKPKNYFVVGDSRQAIYSFKGANYKFFMNLINDPFTYVYELNNNYRCGERIIEFADDFIKYGYDIYRTKIITARNIKGSVQKLIYSAENILELLNNVDYKDWFVLCRTNSEVANISSLLDKNKIPNITFKKSEKTNEEIKEALESDCVKILTIHSAKGLESKNVIVIGAKNWNAEELRICYVAATRAKDNLYWFTAPKKKTAVKTQLMNWG